MICRKCGAENMESAKFCKNCGTRLEIPVENGSPDGTETQSGGEEQSESGKEQSGGGERPEPGKDQPEPGKQRPESGKQQPEPGKQQPESGKQQPEPGKQQPESGKQQPEPGKQRPEPGKQQPESGKQQPESGKQQPEPGKQRPESGKQQPESGKQQPESGKQPEPEEGTPGTAKGRPASEEGRPASDQRPGAWLREPGEQPQPGKQPAAGKKKKGGKVFLLAAAILTAAALGGGYVGGRALAPKTVPIVRKLYTDSYAMDTAAGFYYDGTGTSGQLEILGPQGESLGTIRDVADDCYRVLEKTGQVIYLNTGGQLCIRDFAGKEPVILAEKGTWELMAVSEDESYAAYEETTENGPVVMVYDTVSGEKKQAAEGRITSPVIDSETRTLYYIDSEGVLKKAVDLKNRERIKGEVANFRLLSPGAITYAQESEDGFKTFVNLDGEEERLEDNSRVVGVDEAGQTIFYITAGEENSLYMKRKGMAEAKLFSEAADAVYADNLRLLYVLEPEGKLLRIQMPVFPDRVFEDSQSLKEAVDSLEEEKLTSDGIYLTMSRNGEHVLWVESDKTVYHIHDGMEKAEEVCALGGDMSAGMQGNGLPGKLWGFDQSFSVMDADGTLRRFFYDRDTHEVNGESSVLIAPGNGESVGAAYEPLPVHSPYGDYMAVVLADRGALQVYDRENGKATLIPDVEKYDKVYVGGAKVYGKNLEYGEIAGYYYMEAENAVLKLGEDKSCSVTAGGVEQAGYLTEPESIGKFSIRIPASGELTVRREGIPQTLLGTDSTFVRARDGALSIVPEDGAAPVSLKAITEGEAQTMIKRQQWAAEESEGAQERRQFIEAEKERVEEERRREEERLLEEKRQALLSRAQAYYRNDVYLSVGTQLYVSPSLSSSHPRYVSRYSKFIVYSYEIDYDNSLIWLQVGTTDGRYWVYMR